MTSILIRSSKPSSVEELELPGGRSFHSGVGDLELECLGGFHFSLGECNGVSAI